MTDDVDYSDLTPEQALDLFESMERGARFFRTTGESPVIADFSGIRWPFEVK